MRGLADGNFITVVSLFPFTDLAPGLASSAPHEWLPLLLRSVAGGNPVGSLAGIHILALILINQYSKSKVAAWSNQCSTSPRARESEAAPGEVCITHCDPLGHEQVGSTVCGMSLCEVFPSLGAESKKKPKSCQVFS